MLPNGMVIRPTRPALFLGGTGSLEQSLEEPVTVEWNSGLPYQSHLVPRWNGHFGIGLRRTCYHLLEWWLALVGLPHSEVEWVHSIVKDLSISFFFKG